MPSATLDSLAETAQGHLERMMDFKSQRSERRTNHRHARAPGYPTIAPATEVQNVASQVPAINRVKRRRVACKDCRQAKLRCEGLDGGAESCVRCQQFSIRCTVDLDYKRINKRLKINELAEQVEQLRSALQTSTTAKSPEVEEEAAAPNDFASSPTQHSPLDQPPLALPIEPYSPGFSRSSQTNNPSARSGDWVGSQGGHESAPVASEPGFSPASSLISRPGPVSCSRTLDGITLSPDQIGSLFREFFEHYHPYFEILDPSISPDIYYERAPLLFWTIVNVAARRYDRDATLLATLTPRVTALLWSCVAIPPHSPPIVKAMLLLCMWPFATSSMSTDISFMLASIAKSAAMHTGLHKPEALQDFSRTKCSPSLSELREMVKVWAGCYIAAESVTSGIGQPSLFASDPTIDRACVQDNVYALPENFRYALIIHKFCNRVNRIMVGNDRRATGRKDTEGSILMKFLELDFDRLETQIADKLSPINDYLLSCVCLQLRTYHFFESPVAESRKRGLLLAYAASMDVVSKADSLDAATGFARYAPHGYTQMLVLAAVLIMKIVNSSYSRYVDVDAGKSALNTVLAQLRRASVENNDLKGRLCKILAQLWSAHHAAGRGEDQEPHLKVKTRLGASVLHDSLWTWREQFGGQGPPAPPPGAVPEEPRPSSSSAYPPTQRQPEVDPRGVYPPDGLDPFELEDLDFTQVSDWMGDLGLPMLLPIDVDSFPT